MIRYITLILSIIVIVFGVSFVILSLNKPDTQPKKVYNTPSDKTVSNKDTDVAIETKNKVDKSVSNNNQVVSETSDNDKYDWRDDTEFNDSETQLWETSNDAQKVQADTDDKTYPPKNWHKTKDRELYYVYYHAQLIKQFGDIKQVQTIVDTEYKIEKGIEIKLDEHIQYLESQNYLWPDKRTQEALDKLIMIQNEHKRNATNEHLHDHTH